MSDSDSEYDPNDDRTYGWDGKEIRSRRKRYRKGGVLEAEEEPISVAELKAETTLANAVEAGEEDKTWGDLDDLLEKENKAVIVAQNMYHKAYPLGGQQRMNTNSLLRQKAARLGPLVRKEIDFIIDRYAEPDSDDSDSSQDDATDEERIAETSFGKRRTTRYGRTVKPVTRTGKLVKIDDVNDLDLSYENFDGSKKRSKAYKRVGNIASDKMDPLKDEIEDLQDFCHKRSKNKNYCLKDLRKKRDPNVCAWKRIHFGKKYGENQGRCVLDPLAMHNMIAEEDPERGWSKIKFRLTKNTDKPYSVDRHTTYALKNVSSLQQDEFPYVDEKPKRLYRSNFSAAYVR